MDVLISWVVIVVGAVLGFLLWLLQNLMRREQDGELIFTRTSSAVHQSLVAAVFLLALTAFGLAGNGTLRFQEEYGVRSGVPPLVVSAIVWYSVWLWGWKRGDAKGKILLGKCGTTIDLGRTDRLDAGELKGKIRGTVFKKTFTKPLPAGAKLIVRKGERLAEWLDAKEKRRTAPVTTGKDGTDWIVITARTYTAKYRDDSGIVRETATGCRDETAARSVLTDLGKRADKVRSGIRSVAEDAAIDHQATPLEDHITAFIDHQKAKGISRRIDDTLSQLRRIAADCGFNRLADLDGSKLERWLVDRKGEGMSAATRNEYRGAWVTFCNWCVKNGRLLANPFVHVPKANVVVMLASNGYITGQTINVNGGWYMS